jgi:hypothetical protein
LIGSRNVNFAGLGKPPRERVSKQGEIGAAVNMHQQVEVFARHRLAHKDAMEGFVWSVPSRPDTETIPGFVNELGVFKRRPISRRTDRDEGVKRIAALCGLPPRTVESLALSWL